MTNEPVLKHIRITMLSERYEVAASLFDRVFGDLATQDPQPISETEEMQMGIYADAAEDSGSDYFVKPADPEVLRPALLGETCSVPCDPVDVPGVVLSGRSHHLLI